MEKQLRRKDYVTKKKYKSKQHQQEQKNISPSLIQEISRFDLSQLTNFMNEQYEKTIHKHKEYEQQLNTIIVKKIQFLKKSWISFHTQRLITFLKEHNIPLEYNHKQTLEENGNSIYIKNRIYTNKTLAQRSNKKGMIEINLIMVMRQKTQRDYFSFYCKNLGEDIDFRIDFKRMKKDTTFLLTNFQELVLDVQKQLKVKWVMNIN